MKRPKATPRVLVFCVVYNWNSTKMRCVTPRNKAMSDVKYAHRVIKNSNRNCVFKSKYPVSAMESYLPCRFLVNADVETMTVISANNQATNMERV